MGFFFQLFENGEQNSSGHLRALDSLNLLNMLFLHVVGKLLLIVEIVHSPEHTNICLICSLERSRCCRIAYLRTSGSQIRQKMLRFSRPSPGWHFSRCSEATCCEIRNQEWRMVASLYKLKARYHDPAFNSCPDKNDVHLEANSNEIAAAILTPHCTPGSKVNLCKTNYIFLHTLIK